MKIRELVERSYAQAQEKGFHDKDHGFATRMMLLVTEIAEAFEDFRCNIPITQTTYAIDGKPEGVPSELADVVIRIADTCGKYGIDLEDIILKKLDYNATRPQMHGGKIC